MYYWNKTNNVISDANPKLNPSLWAPMPIFSLNNSICVSLTVTFRMVRLEVTCLQPVRASIEKSLFLLGQISKIAYF